MSAEERAARTSRAREMIGQAIKTLASQLDRGISTELQRYLRAMARFRRYSLGNQLLIATQRPDATRVAGHGAWKLLGRRVSKAQREHGIMILAPIVQRPEKLEEDEEAEEEDEREEVLAFRPISVFDVSQTEGRALPEPSTARGNPGVYLERLKDYISGRNIRMGYRDNLGDAEGMSSGGQITILSSLSSAQQFSTLVHELAHEMLHQNGNREPNRTVRETEAEAVAFVVGHAIGLEMQSSSSDYIQLYQGDRKALFASLQRIRSTAGEIIAAVTREADRRAAGDHSSASGVAAA